MRSETDIVPLDKRTPGVQAIEPLIFPVLEAVYTRREKRLRLLAEQLGEAEEDISSSSLVLLKRSRF